MFDLPTESVEEKQNYRIFKKNLMKLGYIMMQYSIYTKSVNVQTKVERELEKIKKIIPMYGNVRFLNVTENQYQNMKVLQGNKSVVEQINEQPYHIKL